LLGYFSDVLNEINCPVFEHGYAMIIRTTQNLYTAIEDKIEAQ